MLFFLLFLCVWGFSPLLPTRSAFSFLSFLQESIIPRKERHPQIFEKQYNIILDFAIKFYWKHHSSHFKASSFAWKKWLKVINESSLRTFDDKVIGKCEYGNCYHFCFYKPLPWKEWKMLLCPENLCFYTKKWKWNKKASQYKYYVFQMSFTTWPQKSETGFWEVSDRDWRNLSSKHLKRMSHFILWLWKNGSW